ncbi:MAG: STAS/SEC14 domain-containing protein [Candidatus Sulfotelmatobacter sp.]
MATSKVWVRRRCAAMIERLKESQGAAFGFKVVGRVSGDEVKAFEPQIEFLIRERKARPIGILADLSQMDGADWKARWSEMRFLQKYTDHIARMAVVGADKWEEVVAMLLAGTAVLQAETRYFTSAEISAAWEWVRTSKNADRVPVRTMYLGTGLFKDYIPEYTDL